MTVVNGRHLRQRTNISYEVSDSDSDPEANTSSEESVPRNNRGTRRKRAARVATGNRKKKRRTVREDDVPQVEQMENRLFDSLFDEDEVVHDSVITWLADYENDPNAALTLLINFLLKCAGCETALKKHDIELPDSTGTTIKEVENEAQKYMTQTYPMVSTDKKFHQINKTFDLFVKAIVTHASENGMLYSTEFFAPILNWVAGFSVSALMPFRHVATCFLIDTLMALCSEYVSRNIALQKLERGHSKSKGRKKDLKNTNELVTEQQYVHHLESLIEEINEVVACRARDSASKIREEVLGSMDEWLLSTPELFFSSDKKHETFEILVSGLRDFHAIVRQVVVNGLIRLFADRDAALHLRQFSEQLLGQLHVMMDHDVDGKVRRLTIKLLVCLADAGVISDNRLGSLRSYIFDKDTLVRKEAGVLLVTRIHHEVKNKLSSVIDDFCDSHREWAFYRELAEQLAASNSSVSNIQTTVSQEQSKSVECTLHEFFENHSISRIIIAASSLPHLADCRWTDLADMLLFDFSGLEKDSDAVTVCSYHGYLTVLFEILCGQVQMETAKWSSANHPERHKGLHQSLAQYIPRLFEKFAKDSDQVSTTLLQIWSIMDLDGYHQYQQNSEIDLGLFELISEVFSHTQTLGLVRSAQAAFRNTVGYSSIRTTFLDVLQPIAYSLQLSLEELVTDLLQGDKTVSHFCHLRIQLEKMRCLSTVSSSMSDLIVTNGGGNSLLNKLQQLLEWLISSQKATLQEIDDEERLGVLTSVLSIIKCSLMWKLAIVIDDSNDITTDDLGAENILTTVSFLKGFDQVKEHTWQLCLLTTIYQLGVLVKQTVLLLEIDEKTVPHALKQTLACYDETTSKAAMILFLYLEKCLERCSNSAVAKKGLKTNEIDLELYADVEDLDTMSPAVNESDQSSSTLLNFEICKFASLLNLVGAVGLIPDFYRDRLCLNEKAISPEYIKALKESRLSL